MRDDKTDIRAIEQLDVYWDDRDAQPPLPGPLTAVVDALHARARLPEPRAEFVAALEARLFNAASNHALREDDIHLSAPADVPPRRITQPRLEAGLSRRRLLAQSAAVLAGAALTGAGLRRLRSSTPRASLNAPSVPSVWVSIADGSRLVELNPSTLNATQDEASLVATPAAPVDWRGSGVQYLASDDGTTLVRVSAAQPTGSGDAASYTFDCCDGPNGPLRAGFHQTFADLSLMETPKLSPDGAFLIVRSEGSNQGVRSGPPTWYVYDTRRGQLLSSLVSETSQVWAPPVFDPRGRYVYRLSFSVFLGTGDTADTPVQVIAHDPLKGTEVARIDLPRISEATSDSSAGELLQPHSIVATHDGTSLLVLLANRDGRLAAIQTIDVDRREYRGVVRLRAVHPDAAPSPAASSAPGGTLPKREAAFTRLAVLSRDGKTLTFPAAISLMSETDGVFTTLERWLEVTEVDPANGKILRHHRASDAPWLSDYMKGIEVRMQPSADGASLLLAGWPPSATPGPLDYSGWLLQRRDAATFEILAERVFPEYRNVLIW